jgi:hypothetical protein
MSAFACRLQLALVTILTATIVHAQQVPGTGTGAATGSVPPTQTPLGQGVQPGQAVGQVRLGVPLGSAARPLNPNGATPADPRNDGQPNSGVGTGVVGGQFPQQGGVGDAALVAWLTAAHQVDIALATVAQQQSQNQAVSQLAAGIAESSNQLLQLLQQMQSVAGSAPNQNQSNLATGNALSNGNPGQGGGPVALPGSVASNGIQNGKPAASLGAAQAGKAGAASQIGALPGAGTQQLAKNGAGPQPQTQQSNGPTAQGMSPINGIGNSTNAIVQQLQGLGLNFDALYVGIVLVRAADRRVAINAISQYAANSPLQQVLAQEAQVAQQQLTAAQQLIGEVVRGSGSGQNNPSAVPSTNPGPAATNGKPQQGKRNAR